MQNIGLKGNKMVKENETPEETPEEVEEESTEETPEEEVYKGRYSQFAAKTADEYLSKLETAYANSSTEAQKLIATNKDKEEEMAVLTKIVQSDPDLRDKFQEKLYGSGYEKEFEDGELDANRIAQIVRQVVREEIPATLKENPALKKLEEEDIENNRQIFAKFETEHPEITGNIQLQGDLDESFQAVVGTMTKKGGKVDFDKALNKAWRIVSDDDKEYEKILQKDANSMSSGGSSQAKAKGKTLTPAEKAIAEKFGLTDEQYLEGKEL